MICAGVLAGGKGTRMTKASLPKQFLKIGDVPIIIRTIRTFLTVEQFDKIIIAMNRDWMEYCENLFDEYKIDKSKIVMIEGGTTRFESLINVAHEAQKFGDDTILMTHDCARVFVSKKIIMDNLEAIKDYPAVTTSIPVIDTILVSKDGHTSNSVPIRSELFADQGPQTCKTNEFLKLVAQLNEGERLNYMEIGKLYLKNHLKVGIVLGDRMNFKITTDLDLRYAEFLLKEES